MRVAIVHDWLVTYAGSERVVEQLVALFPDADVYSLVDFLSDADRRFLAGKPVRTTFLQRLPLARRKYAAYLPLMPLAIEQLDLSRYDLVLSSSHCVAKGVLTGPDQLHVSYVHTPMRYAWDAQHEYLAGAKLQRGLKSWYARWLLHKLRQWDVRTSHGVDAFVANSALRRPADLEGLSPACQVIYPPVDTEAFGFCERREDFYLTASRLVPYKRVDVLVEAFASLPGERLVVIGEGPELPRLRMLAGPNVTFLGYQDRDVLCDYMQRAKAFLFAAREDFGIVLVEAQASGAAVIALGQGGALETIRPLEEPRPTGVLFDEPTSESVVAAMRRFERDGSRIKAANCRENALGFGVARFRQELFEHVMGQWDHFRNQAYRRRGDSDTLAPSAADHLGAIPFRRPAKAA